MQTETVKQGTLKKWLILLVILAIVAGTILLIPFTPLKVKTKARLTQIIVEQLGAGTTIGNIDYGWRTVVLMDVRLPLDSHGSELEISRVVAGIDAWNLIRGPEQAERVIHSLRLVKPVIRIRSAAAQARAEDQPWLPDVQIPPVVYTIGSRFDSLRRVEIEEARIVVERQPSSELEICRFSAWIAAEQNGLRLNGEGYYLGDPDYAVNLTGLLDPREQTLEVQALLEVPAGNPGTLPIGLPGFSVAGGQLALRMSATGSQSVLRGSCALDGIEYPTPAGPVRAASLRGHLSGDSLVIEPLQIVAATGNLDVSGSAVLRGAGKLQMVGEFQVTDLSEFRSLLPAAEGATGTIRGTLEITGSAAEPVCAVRLNGNDLRFAGITANRLSATSEIRRDAIQIFALDLELPEGALNLAGQIGLDDAAALNVQGNLALWNIPQLATWRSTLSQIEFQAGGTVGQPQLRLALLDTSRTELGQGIAQREDDRWLFKFVGADSGVSRIEVVDAAPMRQVSVVNAQHLLANLFQEWRPSLRPLRALDVFYEGNAAAGALELRGDLDTAAGSVWPRIARNFSFAGHYQSAANKQLKLAGEWSGTAGDGSPFEGRADLTLRDSVLTVDRFFIDTYGEVEGAVDLRRRELDLELSVTDLEAYKLPLPPEVLKRYQVQGALSGFFRLYGSFDAPLWTASIAMIEGSIVDLPGYWMNLEATGEGPVARIERFELGRNIRKIFEAAGTVDFQRKFLGITAEAGSAQAQDFVQALTGQRAIVSGELAGKATISGAFGDPAVEVELIVLDGKLVNDIRFDELALAFRTDQRADGERVLRITRCGFEKTGTYKFSAVGELAPRAGGALIAHVEGTGDFLDILDQLDEGFRSKGSDGRLVMDFGGTVDRPQFLGGELSLKNGRFVYPPATPEDLQTELAFQVDAAGQVESGGILFHTADQWLKISVIANCDSVYPGLEPLIIPRPQLCLGVLQIETGASGITARLPGFMQADWSGTFTIGATAGDPLIVSAWGPDRLRFVGDAEINGARFTFPFISTGRSGRVPPVAAWLVKRLEEADWQLDVTVGSGNHYLAEITGLKNSELFSSLRETRVLGALADYLDHLSIDAVVEPSETPLFVRGVIDSSTFYLNGHLGSTRGKVEYLDQTFRIDYAYADFDGTAAMPILEGRASTTAVDSLGRTVYLTMYQIDRETGIRQRRGRLDQMTFVLEAEGVEAPEYVLQLLGYDLSGARGKAETVVASSFARAIGRRWIDPIERRLERWTLLDEIALTPGGGRSSNLVRQQQQLAQNDPLYSDPRDVEQQSTAVRFLSGSQLTVGKYLTRDLFVTYTGELSEGQIELRDRLGLIHSWNLQYRIFPLSRDLVVDFAVEYDEIIRERDESISLKYSFALEP